MVSINDNGHTIVPLFNIHRNNALQKRNWKMPTSILNYDNIWHKNQIQKSVVVHDKDFK